MKKLLTLIIFLTIVLTDAQACFAINIGSYKTESEYGLIDGFKFNWKRKDKSVPFIEPREQSTKAEKEKDLQEYKDNEYEYTKYLYNGQALI